MTAEDKWQSPEPGGIEKNSGGKQTYQISVRLSLDSIVNVESINQVCGS